MHIGGSNVVITGGSAGIGAAMARAFAGAGGNVTVVARRRDALEEIAREVGGHAVQADLVDEATVDGLVERIEAERGPIDILVNNAGVETIDSAANCDPRDLRQVVRLNVETPMVLTRKVLPGMLDRGRGHLVFMSSIAGVAAIPGMAPYGATKSALTTYASAVRRELAGSGVGVTVVAPGPVDTEMWDQVDNSPPSTQRVVRRLERLQLLPKISPEQLARDVVDAVAHDRRHVRYPKRMLPNFWLNHAPTRIAELMLVGVRFDPRDRAATEPRTRSDPAGGS